MEINYDGSTLDTDYHESRDFELGLPWLLVHAGTWHILLPHAPPLGVDLVCAYPVLDHSEPESWRWRIELGTWRLPLYRRCIRPFRPGFPPRGTVFHRTAILYGSYRPAASTNWFFGSIPVGWQTSRHELHLVRR